MNGYAMTGCAFVLVVLMGCIAVCGVATDYALWFYFGINISPAGDVAIGIVLGWATVPAAIVAWILYHSGVAPPLIHR